MQSFDKLDKQLLKWAYLRPYNNSFFIRTLTFAGEAMTWMTLMFLSAVAGQLLKSERLNELTVMLMLGSAMGIVVFMLCKVFVKRRRPYANEGLQKELGIKIVNRDAWYASKAQESFPSGHVLWTTICTCLICWQFGWIFVLLIGWMIPAMIYLRPHLGVHYPSDTVTSLFTGIAIAAITIFIAPYIVEFLNSLRKYPLYIWGYWIFILGYLGVAIKIWLGRI